MGIQEKDPLSQLSLPPGFRFFPTDEELLVQYLTRKVAGHHFSLPIIAEIDLYKFDPWVLPGKAMFGEKEWYFFSPRDRKYPNGSRPNRVAGSGYWKATGTDKMINTQGRKVGIKKALVFYTGKAPKGTKTNWIMHEYRLLNSSQKSLGSTKLDDWVLCRIYKKNSGSQKAVPSFSTKGYSTGSGSGSGSGSTSTSPPSSSSHIEDMLELPEIDDQSFALPRFNSLLQNEDQKIGFPNHFPDWVNPSGLESVPQLGSQTQGMVNYGGNDMYVPSTPSFCHVDSLLVVPRNPIEEEVQSGVDTNGFTQRLLSGSVDSFGFGYTNQDFGGFGFRD